MSGSDLFLEVDLIDGPHGKCVRIFNDYFPCTHHAWYADGDGAVAFLPMENKCDLQLTVTRTFADAALRDTEGGYANVKGGKIVATEYDEAFVESVEEAYDLWSWMKQLGRLEVA